MSSLLKAIEEVNAASVWPSTEEYNRLLLDNYRFVANHLTGIKGKKVLDVGAAYGVLSLTAAQEGATVIALDNTDRYTNKKLLKKKKIDFLLCDIEKEDIPVEDVDLVIFTEVLEHLNYNPLLPLKRIARTLKAGGRMILTTPRFETQGQAPGRWGTTVDWHTIPESGDITVDEHTHHFSQPELFSLLRESGFKVLEIGECYHRMSHYVIAEKCG